MDGEGATHVQLPCGGRGVAVTYVHMLDVSHIYARGGTKKKKNQLIMAFAIN